MSVAGSLVRERVRDGASTTNRPGGMPATGLTARALARSGGHPLSAQARAAVRAAVIEPRTDAVVKYESSRHLLPQNNGTSYVWNSWAYNSFTDEQEWTTRLYRSPLAAQSFYYSNTIGAGYRRNPAWRPMVLDETPLDTAQLGPSSDLAYDPNGWSTRDQVLEGLPMMQVPNTSLVRPVANPEADAAGTAWTAAAGTYSRPSVPALPSLGLPGTNAHRVSGAVAAHALSSPWVPCRYRMATGRVFTAVAWVTTSVPGSTYRLILEFRNAAGTVTHALTGPAQVVDGPTRLVATMESPTFNSGTFGGLDARTARVRVVCVNAATTTGTLDVRGAHYYAGPDRGDVEGLKAVPIPFGMNASLTILEPVAANRFDVHGMDGKTITAASVDVTDPATGLGVSAVGGSPGRLTLRLPRTVPLRVFTQAQPFGAATLNLEEANTGPGGYLFLTGIEASREADLTDRVVSFEVDRALDSDPSDSTVPIGNYAATSASIEFDNTDRALSPMRSGDPDIGLEVEAAVGVVYTNRHADPLGEGLTVSAWNGSLGMPPVDKYGNPGPSVRGAFGSTVAGARVPVTPGQEWMISAWLLAVAENAHYTVELVWGNSAGVVEANDRPTATGGRWEYYSLGGVAPARASWVEVRVTVTGGGVWVSAPTFELIDTTTGRPVEVVEVAPAGVFTSVDWPTATDSDTVRVALLDVLAGSRGSGAVAQRLWRDTEVTVSLAIVAREYLDLGDDEIVLASSSPVLSLTLPAPTASQMLADLAKAGGLTVYTDGLGRLVSLSRADSTTVPVVEYREDNALIRAGLPFAPDLVRNAVTVTGHPITFVPAYEVATAANEDPTDVSVVGWKLSGQEIRVPYGGSTSILVTWESDAALDAAVAVVRGYRSAEVGTANPQRMAEEGTEFHSYSVPKAGGGTGAAGFIGGSWVKTEVEVYPTFGRITFTYPAVTDLLPGDVLIDHVELRGTAAIVGQVTQEFERAESVEAYGRKPVAVDVRLAQGLDQLSVAATDILDNYSLRDPSGERWLPDLEAEVLGDPWRELGDRVLTREPDTGIGGEYRVVTHKLTVGQSMASSVYLRRVVTGVVYMTLDVSTLDGPDVLGY